MGFLVASVDLTGLGSCERVEWDMSGSRVDFIMDLERLALSLDEEVL